MRTLTVSILALPFAALAAQAGTLPDGSLAGPVDGVPTWSWTAETDGESAEGGGTARIGDDGRFETKVAEVDLGSTDTLTGLTYGGNVDPFHNFSATITDGGAPTTFTVTIITPIVPLTGTVLWAFEGTLSAIDGDGNLESAAPGLPGPLFFQSFIDTTAVASLGGPPVAEVNPGDEAPTVFAANGSFACGVSGCGQIVTAFGMTGSGGNDLGGADQYLITAEFTVLPAPIPLPASALLLAGALIAAAGLTRPRRAG